MKVVQYTEKIALDIMCGESYTNIAKKYNLSTKTIYRLRHSEEFHALLKEQKKKCFELALIKASYLSNIAIDELKNILNSDSSPQNKIQACKIILELAKNNYEYEKIEQRIEEIEKLVNKNEKIFIK